MRPEEAIIPEPLIAAVIGWVDFVCIIALIKLYHFRHEAHIVFRGWTTILIRSILMLLWVNLTVLGDVGLVDDQYLCRFCTASLVFFYSYISSVAVQCWHTYVCWSSLTMIINAHDKRVTILKPPSFLRYRRFLTSPIFEIGLGMMLMVALGAPFLKTMIKAGFDTVDPDGVSMLDSCSGDTGVVTAVVFGIAALALALLAKSLYSVYDRFGLSRETVGISASLGAAAVFIGLESVLPSSVKRLVEFFHVLTIISITLIWSICLPLYISSAKYGPNKLSKSFRKASELRNMSAMVQPGRCALTLSSTLADVLRDDDGGRALFKKFCISEFSVENILWLESSDNLKSKCATFSDQAGSEYATAEPIDFGEFIVDLDNLVQGFIRADGVLTLNLPSSTTAAILDFVNRIDVSKAGSDPGMVQETIRRGLQLIQKVDYCVMDLMKDTFLRFRRSPQYVTYVLEFSTMVDMNPSQALAVEPTRA